MLKHYIEPARAALEVKYSTQNAPESIAKFFVLQLITDAQPDNACFLRGQERVVESLWGKAYWSLRQQVFGDLLDLISQFEESGNDR